MVLFSELGVKVVSGQRFLASYLEDCESTKQYIQQQVLNWVHQAKSQTQSGICSSNEVTAV